MYSFYSKLTRKFSSSNAGAKGKANGVGENISFNNYFFFNSHAKIIILPAINEDKFKEDLYSSLLSLNKSLYYKSKYCLYLNSNDVSK